MLRICNEFFFMTICKAYLHSKYTEVKGERCYDHSKGCQCPKQILRPLLATAYST